MKYHKIPGFPLETCTAEQKIAYNLAWAYSDCVVRSGSFSGVPEAARWIVKLYTLGYSYRPGRYDIDAIFCALNAGLQRYIDRKMPILASYGDIGEMFPADYLEV